MKTEFDGLRVVITGGASGIGLATALAFANLGAHVAILDLRPQLTDPRLFGVAADVANRTSVDAAIIQVIEHLGGIDVLVNNAGISAVGTVESTPDEEWHRILDINVTGIARVTAAALPSLRATEHAAIVNLSSIAALNGLPQRALYAASKGAVLALT